MIDLDDVRDDYEAALEAQRMAERARPAPARPDPFGMTLVMEAWCVSFGPRTRPAWREEAGARD